MDFKRKHKTCQGKRAVISIEIQVYKRLLYISQQEQTTVQEAASRLLEAGIQVYEKERQ